MARFERVLVLDQKATRRVNLSPKLHQVISQQLKEDRYLTRSGRGWGVQIHVEPFLKLNIEDAVLDYVVKLVPPGATSPPILIQI